MTDNNNNDHLPSASERPSLSGGVTRDHLGRPVDDNARAPETSLQRASANFKTIAGAVLLAMLIRIVLFEAFEIEGPSMMPTLMNGDRVVVAKFLYGLSLPFMDDALVTWGTPNVGDVIILISPEDGVAIVKRVIGVPGDTVEVKKDVVYRNGKPIFVRDGGPCKYAYDTDDEPECEWVEETLGKHDWHTSHSVHTSPSDNDAVTVTPGNVFVLGDHRDRSNDSRRIGLIPVGRIKGRALAIYWSSFIDQEHRANHYRPARIFKAID